MGGHNEDSGSEDDLSDPPRLGASATSDGQQSTTPATTASSSRGPLPSRSKASSANGPPLSHSAVFNRTQPSSYSSTSYGRRQRNQHDQDDALVAYGSPAFTLGAHEDSDSGSDVDAYEGHDDQEDEGTASGGVANGRGEEEEDEDEDEDEEDEGDHSSRRGGGHKAGSASHTSSRSRRRQFRLPHLAAAFDISARSTGPLKSTALVEAGSSSGAAANTRSTGPVMTRSSAHAPALETIPSSPSGPSTVPPVPVDPPSLAPPAGSPPTGGGAEEDAASVVSDLNAEEQERFEWQDMLGHVLRGEVLGAEKKRLKQEAAAAETISSGAPAALGSRGMSAASQHNHALMGRVWLGLRAYLRLRTVPEEKRQLEAARLQTDAVLEDVRNFALAPSTPREEAEARVAGLLQRVDYCESLFPSWRIMAAERPAWAEASVVEKLEVLRSWEATTQRLRVQIRILQNLTGSRTLDVATARPPAETVVVQRVEPGRPQESGPAKVLDSSTFVERLLQEGSVKRLFDRKLFETLEQLVLTAKETMIQRSASFQALHLPPYTDDLVAIAAFPPSLMQEVLRARLQNARMLKNDLATVSPVLLAQLTDDFRTSLTHATAVKRGWMAIMRPAPGWDMPQPDAARRAYDDMLANVLKFFFRLLDTNVVQGGNRSLDAKDTEIVEGEWPFLKTAVEEIAGGDVLLGEHYSTLTHRLMSRVQHFFDASLSTLERRLTTSASPADVNETYRWFDLVLASLRQRHRKVLRFARTILGRFENSAEYLLDRQHIDLLLFVNGLIETNHFLIYTGTFEQQGIYLVGGPSLMQRPDLVADILLKCFHLESQPDYEPPRRHHQPPGSHHHHGQAPGSSRAATAEDEGAATSSTANGTGPHLPNANATGQYADYPHYILVLSPRDPFMWAGQVMNLDLPSVDLDVRDHRVRLVAQGPGQFLALAKAVFLGIFPAFRSQTVVDQKAHLARVNKEIKKIKRSSYRMSERVIRSVDEVGAATRSVPDAEPILGSYFSFAAELAERSARYMDKAIRDRYLQLLTTFGIKWISFVSDECRTDDPKTFRAAVHSLEFIMDKIRGDNILMLSEDQFSGLRSKVASCMSLLISHFDVLGARTRAEQKQIKERQEAQRLELRWRLEAKAGHASDGQEGYATAEEDGVGAGVGIAGGASGKAFALSSLRNIRERWASHLSALEDVRQEKQYSLGFAGNELDHAAAQDIGLNALASSTSNVSIRWQQGKFVGGGTFGSVYIALNLESGDIMAVKEIRLQDPATAKPLVEQIRSEMQIMSLLRHEHIVEYYGIEVHRDKVYIFEEYCEGGSLTSVLEHGRIEEEIMSQVYTQQLLLGLAYLHDRGIVHRDIKPDNILLDRHGRLKYVDFGAAKVLNQSKTLAARTRAFRASKGLTTPMPGGGPPGGGGGGGAGGEMTNATGTPMYMSPETIKGGDQGRHGAMDVWSLGCVVLQMITGRKPWSNLDNDWAIMFHIGIATKHPPLPDETECSQTGIDMLRSMLKLDPFQRASAHECLMHPWMLDVAEQLRAMGAAEEEDAAAAAAGGVEGGDTATGAGAVGVGGTLGALTEQEEPEDQADASANSFDLVS